MHNNIPVFTVNNTGARYYGIRADHLKNSISDVISMLNMCHITRWSQYTSIILLNWIILFLRIISGNNLIALLNDVVSYNNNELFNQLAPFNEYNVRMNKYNNVMTKLVEYNHELDIHNRWRSLQFVVNDFNKDELKSL